MLEFSTRLERIDQKVHLATLAIDEESDASDSVKKKLHEFRDKSERMMRELNKDDSDESRLLRQVMELEELGDQARDVAKVDLHDRKIQMESFQSVLDAHNTVSQLKAELTGRSNPG